MFLKDINCDTIRFQGTNRYHSAEGSQCQPILYWFHCFSTGGGKYISDTLEIGSLSHHILVGSFDFQCQTGSLQGLGFRISYCNLWTCGHAYFMRWIYKRLNSLKHVFIFPDSSTEVTESLTWCNRAETFVDLLSESTNTAYTLLFLWLKLKYVLSNLIIFFLTVSNQP